METGSKRSGSKRSKITALIAAAGIVMTMTGCGNVLAGTAAGLSQDMQNANITANVTWFDGIEERRADISVGSIMDISELPDADLSKIPVTEVSKIQCFQLVSPDSLKGLNDLQILNKDHELIYHVGTFYDGAVYNFGGGWYGFVLPNSYKDTITLRVGNTYFKLR